VILLDKKLPLVDGMEVLRQIRADPRTRLIPVVMLTSSAEDRDIIESYQLGVNSYIVKPVDFEQFSETARQLGYYWLLINKQPPSEFDRLQVESPQGGTDEHGHTASPTDA
jgi:two-component system response regulator